MIPKKEQKIIDRFYAMIAKICVLCNFNEKQILEIVKDAKSCIEKVSDAYEKNDYEKAHKFMGEFMMQLQIRRDPYMFCQPIKLSKKLLKIMGGK